MAFVIYHPGKQRFLKYATNSWVTALKNATHFASAEKLENFMQNNYRFTCKDVPKEELLFLDTANLTHGFHTSVSLTAESAQAEFEWLENTLNMILDETERLVALPQYYGELVRDLDLETQDVLHKIEFTNENVVSGFKRYKQLQDVRQRRRKAKDSLEFATLVLSSGLLTSMKTLREEIDKMKSEMENRKYKPRVLTELFEEDKEDNNGQSVSNPVAG